MQSQFFMMMFSYTNTFFLPFNLLHRYSITTAPNEFTLQD
jgi:hypothetical protein